MKQSRSKAFSIKLSKTLFKIEKGEAASEVTAKKLAEKATARVEIERKGGISDRNNNR